MAYLTPVPTRYSQGTGPIVLDDVHCVGTESRLVDCPYDSHTADCTHFQDAGICCQRKCINQVTTALKHMLCILIRGGMFASHSYNNYVQKITAYILYPRKHGK